MKTFGGHEVTFVKNENEVYVTCKGVTGTLTQAKDHLSDPKRNKRFGGSKIKYINDKMHIDCLSDDPEVFKELVIEGQRVLDANEVQSFANELISLDRSKRKQVMSLVEQGDEDICFTEYIDGYEDEILLSLNAVIKEEYGSILSQASSGASGDIKPEYKNVHLPDGTSYSVIYGQIPLPGLDGNSYISTSYNKSGFYMGLECNITNKDVDFVKDFIIKVRKHVCEHSFLNNRLLYVEELPRRGSGNPPKVLDIASLNEIDILITSSTKFALDPFLSRMNKPELCKDVNINPKYSLLLAGPGGTGKTAIMFNYITPIALSCGYTILYSKDAKDFSRMLNVAEILSNRGWKPLLIVEDIDQAFDGETRGGLQQEILNTLDAGHNKTTPIMTIMTTNYIEKISSYMLRAGRISKVIALAGVDEAEVSEFLTKYLGDLKDPNASYSSCRKELAGIVPAFIREIINESKIVALSNNLKYVTPEILITCTKGYKYQEELTKKKEENKTDVKELLYKFFKEFSDRWNDE